MDNLRLYNAARFVPEEAKKPIAAGRLKGKTDISPMWRIKKLTEMFGPCGIGWWYVIKDQRITPAGTDEVAAFVDIDLYYRDGDMVSAPIPGTGGSMFVAKEKSGLYVSDECFKMALTDAISVACKALGVAADVYWDKDRTKYDIPNGSENGAYFKPVCCSVCGKNVLSIRKGGEVVKSIEDIVVWTQKTFGFVSCWACAKMMMDEDAKDRTNDEAPQ